MFFIGDKDKITWEHSDYRAHFVPLRAKLEPIKHKGSISGGPPTIRGDIRIHRDDLHGTTMRENFPKKYQKQTIVDESIRVCLDVSKSLRAVVVLVRRKVQ